jgi:hypothetical protein
MIWGNHFLEIYGRINGIPDRQAISTLPSGAQLHKAGHGFHPHTNGFENREPFSISQGSQTRAMYH